MKVNSNSLQKQPNISLKFGACIIVTRIILQTKRKRVAALICTKIGNEIFLFENKSELQNCTVP